MLFTKPDGTVGWKPDTNAFNCQFSEADMALCRKVMNYKLDDINAVHPSEMHGVGAEQVHCVRDLLATIRDSMKYQPPKPAPTPAPAK